MQLIILKGQKISLHVCYLDVFLKDYDEGHEKDQWNIMDNNVTNQMNKMGFFN